MTQIVIRRSRPRRRSWAILAASVGLMGALGWPTATPASPPDSAWRRTRDGWEQLGWAAPSQASRSPALHPLCAATLELFVVAMALVAAHGADRRSNTLAGAAAGRAKGAAGLHEGGLRWSSTEGHRAPTRPFFVALRSAEWGPFAGASDIATDSFRHDGDLPAGR